jgi:hypothetical protein
MKQVGRISLPEDNEAPGNAAAASLSQSSLQPPTGAM